MLDLTSVTDSARWTLGTRLAFRFAFCYFMTYALCSGIYTVWETIPWAGGYIEGCLAWPFLQAAQLLSPHIFHLHGNAQHRNVHRTVAHRVGSLSRKTNAPTNLRRLTITDLYISPSGGLNVRASNGTLLDGDVRLNPAVHTVKLDMGLVDHPILYTLQQPDASHLALTPIGTDTQTASALTLVRIPLPTHYPLLDRGPRLVINRMVLR